MIVDGKKIAEEIKDGLKQEVLRRDRAPWLSVFAVGENPVSEKFLEVKKRCAEAIGIGFEVKRFQKEVDSAHLVSEIKNVAENRDAGVVVQLPLPERIDTQRILDSIPLHADPDMLSAESMRMFQNGRSPIVPPVIAAIQEILARSNVHIDGKKVVIIGRGRLVGAPAEVWFRQWFGDVMVVDEHTSDIAHSTKTADIILSGAGSPGLITPDMIKEGVVLLDAGTSEAGGKVVGDADPLCAEKASVFTSVPGGIGPTTVAMLFKNLVILTR